MVLKAGARRQQENHTRMMMRRRRVLATEQAQENMVGRDGAVANYWFAIEQTPNRRNEALIVDLEKSRNWFAFFGLQNGIFRFVVIIFRFRSGHYVPGICHLRTLVCLTKTCSRSLRTLLL